MIATHPPTPSTLSSTTRGPSGRERPVEGVYRGGAPHWVGNAFRVRNYFPSGNDLVRKLSPFFLMDYNAPYAHAPDAGTPAGVGAHPHRGFETVTLAFQGSVAHHDSHGGAGVIHPGDVQWMTAASGVLHNEYLEKGFARRGGVLEMMQLWVNLPRAHKMDPPRYQHLTAEGMGRVELPDGQGLVRVIAGEYQGVKGPAKTFSPINLFDVRLKAEGRLELSFPTHQNAALVVLSGAVSLHDGTRVSEQELAVFANAGEDISLQASADTHLLVLNGEPIQEPLVHYGPFVMNTRQEIVQAVLDFNSGLFGQLDD
jgi:redox-sensitive bicupin YhaK (pirin superfamily)